MSVKNHTEYIYVLNLAEERLLSPDGWTDKDNKTVGILFKYITELYKKRHSKIRRQECR